MTDTFRESLANNWNIVGTPTTDISIHWSAQHPTRRRRDASSDEHTHHQTKLSTSTSVRRTTTTTTTTTTQTLRSSFQESNTHKLANSNQRSRNMAPTKERNSPSTSPFPRASLAASRLIWIALAACLGGQLLLSQVALGDESQNAAATAQKQQIDPRSTQPTIDRQLESPSSSSSSQAAPAAPASSASSTPAKPSTSETTRQHEQVRPGQKPQKPVASLASQKKAAALAAQRDYDKYQLKASSSSSPARVAAAAADLAAAADVQKAQADKDKEKEKANNNESGNNNKQSPDGSSSSSSSSSSSLEPAHKKVGQLPNTRPHPKASAFSLLKRFLPSFMTSAAAAAAAASASAVADKQPHQNQHSRSSPATSNSFLSSLLSASSSASSYSSSATGQQQSALAASSNNAESNAASSPLTGKIINLLTGAQKKKGLPEGFSSAIPNHAPFFMRKSAADRQAGGGALALASGLLSNPLKLGLLFSAPLLPSLLLTPLAIAGLSPAMSAINNFFGDDDEPSSSSSSSSPLQSSLSALTSGSSSPLASILQATGASPFASSSSSSGSSSSDSSGSSSGGVGNSLALQAFQSFVLGPTSTTERPLFKPGMFASSGIQNAAGAISSAISSASGQQQSSSSSSSSNSNSQRPFFGSGGGLMQAAASMISPSFAAPPSSSSGSNSNSNSNSNNNDDDGPGLMQMASDVFEKVANYMGNDNNKDGQAIAQASSGPGSPANSPLSTLASLSSMSPFQLSSLFASSPFGTAITGSQQQASASQSSPVGNKNQRVGFFSTLRNVYELFSSSFLRRQEVGNENECQQRLVCELHQRAMSSKLFRRSLQTSLTELANLDKNLIEQIKYGSQQIQARVDPDTKAMLNDFLKATNNFKSGREMINCSQMFPKCTRTQLLAAANAHLADPVNGPAIGKFSQLIKKMKFKSNQQNASQWKLRKPGKSNNLGQSTRTASSALLATSLPPMDHMQVVPLQAQTSNGLGGQLTPADSLKFAQQIMMLSQMSQQQPQQPSTSLPAVNQFGGQGGMASQQMSRPWDQHGDHIMALASYQPPQQQPQQSQPQMVNVQQQQVQQRQPADYSSSANSFNGQQYSPAPKQQTTYTDAMVPTVYSPTESPYFMSQLGGGVGSQQQYMANGQYVDSNQPAVAQALATSQQQQPNGLNNQEQQQQQQQPQQSQQGSYSAPMVDQSMPQQQQPSRGLNMDNKNKPQQLLAPNKLAAIAA